MPLIQVKELQQFAYIGVFPTYWNGFEVVNGDTFFEWKRCEGKIDLLPSQSLSCSSDPPQKMKVESAGTPFPKLD